MENIKEKISLKIKTGSKDLDDWLFGGYEKGIITLFYGPPGSGKSNFVILAACSQAKENKKVIFIDTEGGFSIERVKQISKGNEENILKNILILKPTNFKEQKECFKKLNKYNESKNIELIIVDSITMFYRLELANARKKSIEDIHKINSELIEQMKILYEISRKRNIPILITSQVYSDFLAEKDFLSKEEKIGIVGGDILKYWSKCMIETKNLGKKKKAILTKHRSLPIKEINFEITNEGIKKRNWF